MRPDCRRLPRLLLAALAPVVIALAVAAAAAAPEGGQPPSDAAWHPPAAYAQQATPPKAANVTSDAQSRVYHLGERIEIDVGFDKAVVIDPAAPPSLVVGLDGGVNRTAVYASGNNTAELTFAYTVQYGDVSSDLDYNWTDSLRGSLAGAGGGAANTTLPRPGSPDSLAGSGDILVDYAAPRLIAADTVNPWQRGLGAGNIYNVDILRVENRTYAAAASNSNGLYLIRVHEGGYLSLAGAAPNLAGSSGTPSESRGVDTFTVNGSAYAIATSRSEHAVQLFRVHGNGTLEALGSIVDDVDLRLGEAAGVAAFDLDGTMHALVASWSEDAVQLIRVHGDGTLEARGSWSLVDNATLALDAAHGVAAFDLNGTVHALVTGYGDDAVQLIRVHGNGTLEPRDSLNSTSLPLNLAYRVTAFDLDGTTHALVASLGGSGVQLIRVHDNSSLEAVGSARDGDNSFEELAGSANVDVFSGASGGVYAMVSARGDHGVQLVRVREDGGMFAAGSADYTATGFSGLRSSMDVGVFALGGGTYALSVSWSSNAAALQLMRLSPAYPVHVTSSAADAAYGTGSEIPIAVRFAGPVRVEGGPPELRLGSGATAPLLSGNNSNTLVFNYTVRQGEHAADLEHAGADALSGSGSITDTATGLPANRTLPPHGSGRSLGDLKDIIVDGRVPPVASINSTAANGLYNSPGRTIDIIVAYESAVRAAGPLHLRLNSGGTAHYISGDNTAELVFRYTVGPDEYAADLDYGGLNTVLGSGTIENAETGDPAGRALPAPGTGITLSDLKDIEVDTRAPSIASVEASEDGAYGAGRTVTVTVGFSEPVEYSGEAPVLNLNVSGSPRAAAYESGNGTTELDFSYVVRAGDRADDLAYYNATALAGSVADLAGHPVSALPPPGAPDSLSHSSDVLVDYATPPLIAAGSARDQTPGFGSLSYSLDVDTVRAGNRTYAVVASHGDNAVQLVRVHDNGTLGNMDETDEVRQSDDPSFLLNRPEGIAAFEASTGDAYAIVASRASSGVQTVSIHDDDTLQGADSLGDNATLRLGGVNRVAAFDMGGEAHALVTSGGEGGVQLVRVRASDGSLEARGFLANNASLEMNGAYGVAVFDLGGEKHALVAGHADNGVQLVRVRASDGSLEARGSLGDNASLALGGPLDVAAFYMGGEAHAVVASGNDNGVQLVRVRASDGSLEARGSATDEARGFDELQGARGIAAFELGGAPYAAVASRADNGVQLVRVRASDGALLAAGSAANGAPGFDGLNGAYGIHAFALGGRTYAIVASAEGHAVQLARLSTASVANVTSMAGGGPHDRGAEIDIRVAFDAPVNVTGPIELLLNSGGAARYLSGNGTAELVFRYTVGQGEQAAALDYAGAHALRAGPGGAIIEAKGGPGGAMHHANTALPPPGSPDSLGGAAAIRVDAAAPTVVSVSSPNATGPHGPGDTIHIHVNLSEPVTVRGTPLLALDTGQAGRSAEYASGSGTATLLFLYDVAAGDDSTDLDYAGASALSLGPGGAIVDGVGHRADLALPGTGSPGSLAGTSGLWVDGVRPLALSVSSPNATGPHGPGDTIHIIVNFSETVTVRGTPLLALDTGQAGRAAEYASGSGTASLLFLYDVAAGDDSADLDYTNASALSLGPGGAITDGAGNDAYLALPLPSSGASLGDTSDVSVQGGAGAAAATARAAFTGPNTVRIEYSAPLGPPAGHEGPVYGSVTAVGGDAAAPEDGGVSGLGTAVHTVRFGGAGVNASQTGTIALNTDLEGEDEGIPYAYTADTIAVRAAGESAGTATPAGPMPVVVIEPDSFVRTVNVTSGGDSVRLGINVSELARAPLVDDVSMNEVAFPAEIVRLVASFAEVSFPPNVNATAVPADGRLDLYVSDRRPPVDRVAEAHNVSAARIELQKVVEVGDPDVHIVFDRPVRVQLNGQAGGLAFYVNNTDGSVVPIGTPCDADDTDAVHRQLNGSGECQTDSGADKAIHTYHLTRFGTAALTGNATAPLTDSKTSTLRATIVVDRPEPEPGPPVVPTVVSPAGGQFLGSGGGGGGGGSGGRLAPAGTGGVTLYGAAWDCNEGTIRITVNDGIRPEVSVLSSGGAAAAQRADGPHPAGRTVYEAPLPGDSILSIRAVLTEGRTVSMATEAVRTGGQCAGEAVFERYGGPAAAGMDAPEPGEAAGPAEPAPGAPAEPAPGAPVEPAPGGTADGGAADDSIAMPPPPSEPPADQADGAATPAPPPPADRQDAEPVPAPEAAPPGDEDGGCLIATAAHGTELAPQVQRLREVRDSTLLTTESGRTFMSAFGAAYYAFSPQVADLERGHPAFRQAVAALAAPMLYALTVVEAAEPGSEAGVVAYGALAIALVAGMYVAAPAAGAWYAARRLGALRRHGRA